jgi:fatty acid desaturase
MSKTETPTIGQLRKAIPDHCFQPSTLRSSFHVVFDLTLCLSLAVAAFTCIPLVETTIWRWALWATYGYAQGLICTGIWILAHECGHGALFSNKLVCDVVGWALHSMLMVPYFSWKYSHARHHRYTNHMEKDTAFVRGCTTLHRRSTACSSIARMACVYVLLRQWRR